MPNYNKITLAGHVGQDATIKEFENGTSALNFTLAVSERWTGKDGAQRERTDWFNCEYFVKSTKVAQYLKKGAAVMLAGAMVSRQYQKDDEKRTAWAVRVHELQLMGGGKDGKQQAATGPENAPIVGNSIADIKKQVDDMAAQNKLPF